MSLNISSHDQDHFLTSSGDSEVELGATEMLEAYSSDVSDPSRRAVFYDEIMESGVEKSDHSRHFYSWE